MRIELLNSLFLRKPSFVFLVKYENKIFQFIEKMCEMAKPRNKNEKRVCKACHCSGSIQMKCQWAGWS